MTIDSHDAFHIRTAAFEGRETNHLTSFAQGAHRSLIVVRTDLRRITPAKFISRISRATIHGAMSKPSRWGCRQILRTPEARKSALNTPHLDSEHNVAPRRRRQAQ
ncbi:hypothetical protein SPHINGOAX6_70831 [Sphingomonas sp. AX6]|nr:hypothetical protein SPHINGOAX6_70831 [Sphingomonas sp. AX6]